LLDEEDNAQQYKKIANDFSAPDRARAGDRYSQARKAIRQPGVFYESEIRPDEKSGSLTLCGEKLPGPSMFVRLSGEMFGDAVRETNGYYGYMSAMTHPTVFAFIETLSKVADLPENFTMIPYARDGQFTFKLTANSVRSFHNAWRTWIAWTNTGMDEATAVHDAFVSAAAQIDGS